MMLLFKHSVLTVGLLLAYTTNSLCMALASTNISDGVAVVGCGVLGTSLCKQLLEESGGRIVTGITKTSNRHSSIRQYLNDDDRFTVQTCDEAKGTKYKDVVFCAPPSGFDDYAGAVRDAAVETWAGPQAGGTFVFTSSGAVYDGDGVTVTEKSPLSDTPRAQRLIQAEQASLQNGGRVLRLAGLYTLERGAHNFWLTRGVDVAGRSDGIINLLHYDDAAGACMAAILAGPQAMGDDNNIFLISDGNPLTRKEICEVSLQARMYQDKTVPAFLGTETDPRGKTYDGSHSSKVLSWKPMNPSFAEFMAQH